MITTWMERGAAVVSKQIADRLLKEGHEVFIYARSGEKIEVNKKPWCDYRVIVDNSFRYPMSGAINKRLFLNTLKSLSIDAVIFNEQQSWLPVLWAKRQGVLTGSYVDYYTKTTLVLFSVFDFLICNTKRHFDLMKQFGNASYIPWGTDIGLYNPNAAVDRSYDFFHSAGMNPYRKGTDLLIRALFHVSRKNSGIRCLVHTQKCLRIAFPLLEGKIETMESDGTLSIVNETISAPGLYDKGKIYVYPSRLEGIGLTLAEAKSMGCTLITTDEPPMNEFCDPNTDLVIPVNDRKTRDDNYYWDEVSIDVECLANQMLFAIGSYTDEHAYKSRKYAIEYLNWDLNSPKLSECLKASKTKTSNFIAFKCYWTDFKRVPLYYFFPTFMQLCARFAYFTKKLFR